MEFLRSLFKFFDSKRISIIDLASVGLLVDWIRGGTWNEFLFPLGFMVVMGLLKATVTLGEETAHLDFVAKEIEKYAKPKEESDTYPKSEWDEKPIE